MRSDSMVKWVWEVGQRRECGEAGDEGRMGAALCMLERENGSEWRFADGLSPLVWLK